MWLKNLCSHWNSAR